MRRTLDEIRKEFEGLESSSVQCLSMVTLMNELERDYGTFRIDPSEVFLSKPEVILYRKISSARVFD
ncbi:hypothetical protein [Carnobacterium pleistocenium]|uniref:hypothetical protein n=1 Tax=Carnobacterium pleistocenium TaxID=181073 RepID=UPI0005598FFB|nr:hypothetical protein [Carnobacterium pleistocenium]